MKPATTAKRSFVKTKMMIINPSVSPQATHATVGHLSEILQAGDLLVVNSASTLPSSFTGTVESSGESVEIRLAAFRGPSTQDLTRWSAVLFGAGDWRTATESRLMPPALAVGEVIRISPSLSLLITARCPISPRLVHIEFKSDNLVHDLYLEGKPIQYSYLEHALDIWDQQTPFSGAPISVEPPSAAFPLTWQLLFDLQKKGVVIAPLIHSAGISSTGDTNFDALLPFEEFYEVPLTTLAAIQNTHQHGRKVIALGTSVTRAIESALLSGNPTGLTSLKLGPKSQIRGVDVLITGMHEEGTSHAELMKAFCDCQTLQRAVREAHKFDYRSHEFGDLTLLDCGKRGDPKD